jgi:hypothetical protein
MSTKKQVRHDVSRPYLSRPFPEDASALHRAAHTILTQRGDVLPSIERILQAGLPDEVAIRALGLFHDALSTTGDPNRDPRVAMANASAEAGQLP